MEEQTQQFTNRIVQMLDSQWVLTFLLMEVLQRYVNQEQELKSQDNKQKQIKPD